MQNTTEGLSWKEINQFSIQPTEFQLFLGVDIFCKEIDAWIWSSSELEI